MLEYILLGYALSIIVFFGWTLKDAQEYSFKIVLYFLILSLVWPIVSIVFLLSDKE